MNEVLELYKEEKTMCNIIPEWLERQYAERADCESKAGGGISIDYDLPSVNIVMSDGSEYFFQEHQAEDLLKRVPENVDAEDFLLAQAQNW